VGLTEIPLPITEQAIGTVRVPLPDDLLDRELEALTASAGIIAEFETSYLPDLTAAITNGLKAVQRNVIERLRASATTIEPVAASAARRAQFANPWHDEVGRFAPKGTGRKFDSVTDDFAEPPDGYRPEAAENWRAAYAYMTEHEMPAWWMGTEIMDADGLPKRDNEVGQNWDHPDIIEEMDAWKAEVGDAVADGVWSIGRAADAAREYAIQIAISTNQIDLEAAEERWGYDANPGGAVAGNKWEDLPPVLYHATSALSAIEAHGALKTRDEIGGRANAAGLGGGSSDTISFTSDRAVAEGIVRSLHEVRRAVNMDNDELRSELEARAGDWWPDVVESARSVHGIRDAQPETIEDRYNLYRIYSAYRERNTGVLDPMFFNVDPERLARMDANEIGIVTVEPAMPGARGYQVSALGEWRTPTGRATQITNAERLDDHMGFSVIRSDWHAALVAAGPFDLPDFNVLSLDDWVEAFDVEAVDIVGDVIVDAATGQPLRVGLNVADNVIHDLIDRHVGRLRSLGPLVQQSVAESLRMAVSMQLSLEEAIREIRATGPLSDAAARMIARTELTAATNGGMLLGWQRDGLPFKRWHSLHDERVRHAHLEADGQTVPTEQEFEIGGHRAMYPGDPRLPIELRANCRCYMDRIGQSGRRLETRLVDMTRAQLYRLAQELNIPGRAAMKKDDLFAAIDRYRNGFGYQSLEEMTLAQLMIRARAAGIVGRSRMRKPELMVRLRDRSRGRSRERFLIDAGHGTPAELEAARAQLAADLAALNLPGPVVAAASVSAEQTATIRADVFHRYGGEETGTIVCVACGARLHWSAATRWEQMTLLRLDPNRAWSAANVMPLCLADTAKLATMRPERRVRLSTNLNRSAWSAIEFANPWHDHLGRFAPKGYGTNRSVTHHYDNDLLGGTYNDTWSVTAADGSVIELSGDGAHELTDEQRSEALNAVADAWDLAPLDAAPPKIIVHSNPDKRESVMAWVEAAHPSIINLVGAKADWDTPYPTDKPMPSEREVPKIRFTATHEYGHLYLYANEINGEYPKVLSTAARREVRTDLSEYGSVSPIEAHAEAFAEYFGTAGSTQNRAALAFAEAMGWRDELPGRGMAAAGGIDEIPIAIYETPTGPIYVYADGTVDDRSQPLTASAAQFANPWHDEIGRFAPKGYVRTGKRLTRTIEVPRSPEDARAVATLLDLYEAVIDRPDASGLHTSLIKTLAKRAGDADPELVEKYLKPAARALADNDLDTAAELIDAASDEIFIDIEESFQVPAPEPVDVKTMGEGRDRRFYVDTPEGGRIAFDPSGYDVSDAQIETILSAATTAARAGNVPGNISIQVQGSWNREESMWEPQVMGFVTYNDVIADAHRTINLTPNLIRGNFDPDGSTPRIPELLMASAATVSPLRHTVMHEMGHVSIFDQVRQRNIEEWDSGKTWFNEVMPAAGDTITDTEIAFTSQYGRTNTAEMHAELFAEWVNTGGTTTNPVVQRYADLFNWAQPGTAEEEW
jgi:hypothetical protein